MGQNNFLESLVEIMLTWTRWLTSWFWGILNSDGGESGFMRWFSSHWVGVAVFLIVVGVFVDWLIWMIRWRPYWLWIRKRQYVYEEVEVRRKPRRKARKPARPKADEEYDDPFAVQTEGDPYAQVESDLERSEFSEWDGEYDPYARQPEKHTSYDPRVYGRPVLGEEPKNGKPKRQKPVFGERMNHTHVDDGRAN